MSRILKCIFSLVLLVQAISAVAYAERLQLSLVYMQETGNPFEVKTIQSFDLKGDLHRRYPALDLRHAELNSVSLVAKAKSFPGSARVILDNQATAPLEIPSVNGSYEFYVVKTNFKTVIFSNLNRSGHSWLLEVQVNQHKLSMGPDVRLTQVNVEISIPEYNPIPQPAPAIDIPYTQIGGGSAPVKIIPFLRGTYVSKIVFSANDKTGGQDARLKVVLLGPTSEKDIVLAEDINVKKDGKQYSFNLPNQKSKGLRFEAVRNGHGRIDEVTIEGGFIENLR